MKNVIRNHRRVRSIDDRPIVRRATTLDKMEELLDGFFSDEAYENGLKFKPKPTDIIISPYAKSGTTLLQQIAHQLRTRGSMDFEEITAVTPWIEVASDVGWDLDAPQVAEPRLFKSHMHFYEIPKGCKYIYSFRHPYTQMESLYRFFEGYYFEAGSIDMKDLVRWRNPADKMGESGYWHHIGSWWEQRDNDNVLLFCYEDMVADRTTTIRRVADFMGITLDDELLEIVLHNTSRDFMVTHARQFDSHPIIEAARKRINMEPPLDSNKVTPGERNDPRYKLSTEDKELLDGFWDEHFAPKYGLKNYDELRKKVSELHS